MYKLMDAESMDIESNEVSLLKIDQHLSRQDSIIDSNDSKEEESTYPHLLSSNIIGTHPNEIITSTNLDNDYPVRQENGQNQEDYIHTLESK